MTGYTVHTGSNDKFSSGWDRIFEGKNDDKKSSPSKSSAKSPTKGEKAAAKTSKTSAPKAKAATSKDAENQKTAKGTSRKK